jgi:hypothetical protein
MWHNLQREIDPTNVIRPKATPLSLKKVIKSLSCFALFLAYLTLVNVVCKEKEKMQSDTKSI